MKCHSLYSLSAVVLLLLNIIHAEDFHCPDSMACIVTCANATATNSTEEHAFEGCASGGRIIGNIATHLTVRCIEDNACANLEIQCPINENEDGEDDQHCAVLCEGDGSCTGVTLYSQSSYAVTVDCGAEDFDDPNMDAAFCDGLTIDGMLDNSTETVPFMPIDQGFCLNCRNQENGGTHACTNIMIRNIGVDSTQWNYTASLAVMCLDPSSVSTKNIACNLIAVEDNLLTTFDLMSSGGVNGSTIDIQQESVDEVTVTIMDGGFMANTEVNADNSQSFGVTVETHGNLESSHFYGDEFITDMKVTFMEDANVQSTHFIGGIKLESAGLVTDCSFVSYKADSTYKVGFGSWDMNEIHQIAGDVIITFEKSSASGDVFASTADSLVVSCSSYDKSDACSNLELQGPAKANGSFLSNLECIGYGCDQLTLSSMNGLSDWGFETKDCTCDLGHCMTQFNVKCGVDKDFSEALVTKGNRCKMTAGDLDCCDEEFADQGQDLRCADGSSSSELSGGAIAGIVVAVVVVFILLVIAGYWFYRSKSDKNVGSYVGLAATQQQQQETANDYGALTNQ